MATATTQPLAGGSQAFKKVEMDVSSTAPITKFDPAKHTDFEAPKEFYTLEELGLFPEGAISHVAITAPFPLFSAEGIKEMRADLFRAEMLKKHMYTENKDPGVYKLRGYGPDAPFVYSTWTSPEILAACSKAAGCELEVVFDYEIGHINVQLPPGVPDNSPLDRLLPPAVPPHQVAVVEKAAEEAQAVDEGTITAWHNDSYPWVCVCMLSDPTGMKGGETALRKGDGSIFKVRGPQIGSAVMMQGGVINHVALKALGEGERITMVTSFRPKDPLAYDASNLGNVKKVSNHDQLFKQWTTYRAEVLAKRAQALADTVKEGELSALEIRAAATKWAEEQINYINHTVNEMTESGMKGNYNT